MSLFDTVRRPEYTGERRCWPCTVVNAAVIAVVCLLLAPFSYGISLLVGAVGVGLVYLRGYAVPFTPTFAPKLVARLPVDFGPTYAVGEESGSLSDVGVDDRTDSASNTRSDKNAENVENDTEGGDDSGSSEDTEDSEDSENAETRRSDALTDDDIDGDVLVRELAAAGVFTENGELYLTDAFVDEWTDEMTGLREADRETLAAAAADAMPAKATWTLDDDWVVLDADGAKTWLTESVAIAETSAVRALRSHDVDDGVAAQAANPLRMFLPECPVCGGGVVETTVRNCCGGTMGVYDSPDIEVLACESCDELLYEF
ncbi:hypothetical protein AUR64_18815 [Haloprofundus marisrubri]|uniref:Uncharacterized protein n=1 Tax=Haloprofundus marisrubri TaxID=1514971 RepID=A0A0W1R4L8_9EURY|nr:hypothetical protein [Haloprofundus marisrubri]KTG08292.1 hypothetical protein AUR64_18815 [Haloprofundus marisrubri]